MKQICKKLISSILVISLLAGIAMVSTAAPATPEDADNLIKASNFYEGNEAWKISANSMVDEAIYNETYVEEEVPTIGKTRVLKITQKSEDDNKQNAVMYQNVRLEKGSTYKLSFWLQIKGEGSEFKAYYNPVGEGAYRTVIESGITATNGEWKKFEYTFNVEYATGEENEEYIRFEMADTAEESDVVFQLTDVRLEKTTKNYVPSVPSARWSSAPNGNSVTLKNGEIQVIMSGNTTTNANITFEHDMEVGQTYVISFHIEIKGDTTNTEKTNNSDFNIYELNGRPNNMIKIDSTDSQMDYEKEWKVESYTNTPKIRMYFARPSEADKTITYTITNLTIVEQVENDDEHVEDINLVTTQPSAITTSGPIAPVNLCGAGSFELKENIDGENFAMSTSFLNGNWSWGAGDNNVKTWAKWEVVEDTTYGNAFKISSILEETSTTSKNSWLNHSITWDANKTYTISFKMKTEEKRVTGFYAQVGSKLDYTITNPSTEWKSYSIDYKPETSGSKNLQFMVQMKTGEVLYLADVQVKEKVNTQPDVGKLQIGHARVPNTEYTISFKLDIQGDGVAYTNWGNDGWFAENQRGVLCQTGFAGGSVLTTFDATEENTFSYTYIPTEVDESAETSEFTLYFAPTTGGELTYKISDLSITYRNETVINQIVVGSENFSNDTPGAVSFSPNESSGYTLVERWERVKNGTFATSDATINEALTTGAFTEFASGADYRYSLVVKPEEGYYFSENISLILGEDTVEADYYYCEDGSIIIYPINSEVFFTVMGDANKDGSADVRDLVRMSKNQKNPQDESSKVYLKKCKFETTTPNSILEADVKGLRELLVK